MNCSLLFLPVVVILAYLCNNGCTFSEDIEDNDIITNKVKARIDSTLKSFVNPVNDLTAVLFVQLTPYDQIKLHNTFRDAVYGNIN